MVKQKTKMSLKKKIGIFFLFIIAILVAYQLLMWVKHSWQAHAAKQKVTDARQKIESQTDNKVADFEAALVNAGIATTPIASSKVSVCYVNHDDQGWFAVNWYQGCYLRYVRGYTTGLSKQAIEDKIAATPALLSNVGTLLNDQSSICEVSYDSGKVRLTYLPSSMSSLNDSFCQIPEQLQGISTIDPVILDDHLSVKAYKLFDPHTINSSQDQIWFDYDQPYYHEDLGCGFDFIFCGNPRAHAAQD